MWWFVIGIGAVSVGYLLCSSPDAGADPIPVPVPLPVPGGGIIAGAVGGGGGGGGPGGVGIAAPGLAPQAATIFLCPGVGGAAAALGAGGGYCDFSFSQEGHIHCEWGGLAPVVDVWNCWRVWRGQPDHPAHPDPDIVPDGWGVPWALNGPTPQDQWPPPGLAPAPPPQSSPAEPAPPP